VNARAGFIENVDGLVWQKPVADVAVRELYAGIDRFFGIRNMMMVFVFLFDVSRIWIVSSTEVESTITIWNDGQAPVFLDILSVFVKRCSADTLYLAAGKGGLEHVGSIQ